MRYLSELKAWLIGATNDVTGQPLVSSIHGIRREPDGHESMLVEMADGTVLSVRTVSRPPRR